MGVDVLLIFAEEGQLRVSWEELGIADYHDRRMESRVAVSIRIEVTGFDFEGKFFSETTRTIDISKTGCGFRLKRRLLRGGILAIKILDKDAHPAGPNPFFYQVARSTPEAGRWITGAAKLQSESLWSALFPEAESAEIANIS